MPRIDDTLDTLSGSQWFSTLNLLSRYWQVEVAESDREKIAFTPHKGLFEFKVMPFGLCNALSHSRGSWISSGRGTVVTESGLFR